MKRVPHSRLLLVWLGTIVTLACTPPVQPAPDTRAADEAAIREAETAWSKLAGAGQTDAVMSYYSDDAVSLPPHAPLASGKDAIRKGVSALFATPGFSIEWQPVKVEVARSGDLGYAQGTFQLTVSGPKGKPVMDHGKFLTIWKKQADGTWKATMDTFNSDLPAAQPN